jgi:RNA polymerase sigma-70 factor (ECF subfamily)
VDHDCLGRPEDTAATPAAVCRPARKVADTPSLRVVDAEFYPDWDAVYRDNATRVYRLMYAKVGNRADAEDLTAEVFTAALRPLRVSATAPEVRAYLFTTARTVLAAHWRRTLGHEITVLDADDERWLVAPSEGPAEPTSAPERAAALLAALPEPQRRILELRFLQACSVREAAEKLGITVSHAKVLQHRALRAAAKIGQVTA